MIDVCVSKSIILISHFHCYHGNEENWEFLIFTDFDKSANNIQSFFSKT